MSSNPITDDTPVSPELQRLDFGTPRRPDVESSRLLRRWLQFTAALIDEKWSELLVSPIEVQPIRIDPATDTMAYREIPREALGFHITIGEKDVPALLIISVQQAQGLIADVLGLDQETWPRPTRPTPAERSILETLFESSGNAIGEGWPGRRNLDCGIGDLLEQPTRARLFPPRTALLVGRFLLRSRFGDETLFWLTPKDQIEQLLEAETEFHIPEEHHAQERLTGLVKQVPVSVSVELGRVQLTMSQIADLQTGDVVLLDQSVHRSLIVRTEGQQKWRGQPVCIGNRLGLEITEVIEECGL